LTISQVILKLFSLKDEIKDKAIEWIKELKIDNIQVRFLRLDDARENYALEKECEQQYLAVKFEYSGLRTPPRNGKVERKFQKLYGRIQAIINESEIDGELRDDIALNLIDCFKRLRMHIVIQIMKKG
jgi:hypothetical protein